jgi:hypothetical protein
MYISSGRGDKTSPKPPEKSKLGPFHGSYIPVQCGSSSATQ